MNLNHINLPTTDVTGAQAFFARYFGMRTRLERGQNFLVMMEDEAGMVLNLSNFHKEAEVVYPRDFHVGFFVDSPAQVDAVYAQMTGDGLEAAPPRRLVGRGWTFYVNAPGGIVVEVACLAETDREA